MPSLPSNEIASLLLHQIEPDTVCILKAVEGTHLPHPSTYAFEAGQAAGEQGWVSLGYLGMIRHAQ